ncbi:hypothetical protein C1N64_15170 [Pantoea sp. SGAir0215]
MIFDNGLVIFSTSTKQKLFIIDGLRWEAWPDNGDDTVNYRAVFNIKIIDKVIFTSSYFYLIKVM